MTSTKQTVSMSWLTLSFEPSLEAEYKAHHFRENLRNIRVSLLLGALLYSVFGLLDAWVVPEIKTVAWVIRYAILDPVALVLVALSFSRLFERHYELFLDGFCIVGGLGVVAMIVLARPFGQALYYAGLIIVIFYYYAFLKVRFIHGLSLSLFFLATYVTLIAVLGNTDTLMLINNMFFLASAAFIGAVAGYTYERNRRESFLQKRLLEQRWRELEQKNLALTSLSSEIAHELRNPLTSVKGLAGLVAKELTAEKGKQRAKVLQQEIERMQGIVTDFLDFSRPLVPLNKSMVDIEDFVRDVMVLHEDVARQRDVTLELVMGSEAPSHLSCDLRKVTQILVNVVQNALDASPDAGTITIAVSAVPRRSVQIEVIDEGDGLDERVRDNVFAHGVTSKAGGSGLGLAISRAIAEQHGGSLTLHNGQSRGCIATVTLPIGDDGSHQDAASATDR